MENRLEKPRIHESVAIVHSPFEAWQTTLAFVFLTGGFLGIISWFNIVDVYHNHFFEIGSTILAYNLFRIAFACYLVWIVYVSGYGLLALMVPAATLRSFLPSERVIFGFSIGLGVWHLFMLILGICHLYYQPLMIGLCLIVLSGSTIHFKNTVRELIVPQQITISILTTSVICIALFWLLLVRGLYPGGGGDYFTHYFYYYLSVIKNHGLAPNDVWYHYYYSKGAGLHFLGMLLTDPEAPEIATYSCVAIAILAMVTLTNRFAPRSLWPAFCAVLFVAYNLVGINGGGGEFQKTHEETSAMVILATWVICMYQLQPKEWEKPAFITLTALMIGSAIVTQPIAVYFAVFFALQTGMALLRKNWPRMKFYFLLGSITTATVLAILMLNYLTTGLLTDQAINFTWKFANVERLNQWGVLPNIAMVAWIRDNYDKLATPLGWESVQQLATFMRIDALWVLISSTFLMLFFALLTFVGSKKPPASLLNILITVSLLIVTFGVISFFAGHSQAASYFRFSSFFFPLLSLFCVLCWAFICTQWQISKTVLPIITLILVIGSWQHWARQAHEVTRNAMHFLTGHYSIADAYAHQHVGLAFGGIHPGAYQAMLHTPHGSRIWSTSVDTYCMAPNCIIESVISFKLSPRMNEILSGTPEQARKILQEENLNYFIFTDNGLLLDLLPYSQLFNPNKISKYLAIKWTDGQTYLLTWPGPDTKPIDKAFLTAYKKHLNLPEHSWFLFREAVPALNNTMTLLTQSPHPWQPIEFPWRKKIQMVVYPTPT